MPLVPVRTPSVAALFLPSAALARLRSTVEVHIVAGLLALLAGAGALLDLRMLVAGSMQGTHRLIRHLWRMGFAMWTATMSFFIGQAKVFPDPVRKYWLLSIPVVVVAALLFYWLLRVLIRKDRALPPRVAAREVRA